MAVELCWGSRFGASEYLRREDSDSDVLFIDWELQCS
jgi:hypothetical protein